MLSVGIKVSEQGHDVKTAEDKNLSLKTGFSLLNVLKEGSLTSGSGTETVSHGLGYEPQFLAWVFENGGVKDQGTGLATGLDDFGTAFIDDSDLNIFTDPGDGIRYYIFYEPLDTGTASGISKEITYGIKVSKDGFDVKNANILQQTFNSEKNSMKIFTNDTDSHTVNTSYNFLIPHNLSTNPGYLLFFEIDNSGYWFSENMTDTLSGKNVNVSSWTTDTFLVVSCNSDSSCTVKLKYYILADPSI